MRAILVDLGGVLSMDAWPQAAQDWGPRLGITPTEFLAAVFGGSDHTVLIGHIDEDEWWQVVAGRLHLGHEQLRRLRADLDTRETWNRPLLDCLATVRATARTAIVSNAWPATRARLHSQRIDQAVDELVLSCEVGVAKPDGRIYRHALDRLGVTARQALFVDDTPGHVAAARQLGMTGHVHRHTTATIAAIERFRLSLRHARQRQRGTADRGNVNDDDGTEPVVWVPALLVEHS